MAKAGLGQELVNLSPSLLPVEINEDFRDSSCVLGPNDCLLTPTPSLIVTTAPADGLFIPTASNRGS